MELKIYYNPKEFLEEAEPVPEEKEMQNNLLLGNCYNILMEDRKIENAYFILFEKVDLPIGYNKQEKEETKLREIFI